ncbi:hypothetical protein [Oceanibacterium hippocampi]|uniref:Lipoprotein n=1 Tax=Oceanibacterium hippocampi TaxID=745714 RepID=A0A1Y5RVP4_9PROT|nr:hypothetical protein [Oceanibacterium hippocampi]SLN25519.1 hypothetical protein OCH7691_00759 [Oceanibacterium hippocampi]
MIRKLALSILAVAGLALAACSTPPKEPVFPDITFAHKPQIRLAVSAITVRESYLPPLKAPNVEHEFPVTISQAARRWIADRLVAVGGPGVATVDIVQASAVETELPKQGGVKGLVTKQQAQQYDATLKVEITVQEPSGAGGFAAAETVRTISVPENITLNERDKAYYRLTEGVMNDFDMVMEDKIRQFLGAYIR